MIKSTYNQLFFSPMRKQINMIELIHYFRFRHSQFATVFFLNDKCCDLISHPYFGNRTLMLSCASTIYCCHCPHGNWRTIYFYRKIALSWIRLQVNWIHREIASHSAKNAYTCPSIRRVHRIFNLAQFYFRIAKSKKETISNTFCQMALKTKDRAR